MHSSFLAFSATELWHERSLEADRRWRLLNGAGPLPRRLPRRVLGQLAAWVSRTAASIAVRLDDRVTLGA